VEGLITKNQYKRVMALSSSFGKDTIPRIAGKYEVQPIGDIIEIIVPLNPTQDKKTFVRPTYAGNALTKVKSE
jgi:electron transfer flavoprotein alpha subunit